LTSKDTEIYTVIISQLSSICDILLLSLTKIVKSIE